MKVFILPITVFPTPLFPSPRNFQCFISSSYAPNIQVKIAECCSPQFILCFFDLPSSTSQSNESAIPREGNLWSSLWPISTSKWDITAFLFLWKCCSCNSNPKILKTKANIIKTKCTLVKSYTRMHYLPTLKKKRIIEASISWKETLLSCAPFWCSQSNSHLECLFTKTPQIRIFSDFLNPFYTVIWIHNRIWTCCFL